MSDALRHPVTAVRVVAVRGDHHLEMPDQVATEEPMEIRAAGPGQRPAPIAVTMRTPGHDFDLAVGFLFTEGLIKGVHDVAAVKYCDLPDDVEQRFNTVTVELTRPLATERATWSFAVNASCGVCGKTSIDEVTVACAALADGPGIAPVAWSLIAGLPDRLREQQKLFDRTGGLHAAATFNPLGTPAPRRAADPGNGAGGVRTNGGTGGYGGAGGESGAHETGVTGELEAVREDVGRHNAVDKLVGHALLTGRLPLTGRVLVVSGRVSFEIVQKAAMAGLAVIAAVSAPTSLAVEAADRLGVTLVGFVRGERFNIYTHPERIDLRR